MSLQKAITMLGLADDARFAPEDLTGPRHATLRSCLLTELLGVTITKAQAGVNRLRDAFYVAAQVSATTYAGQAAGFRDYCEGRCSVSDNPLDRELAETARKRRERKTEALKCQI